MRRINCPLCGRSFTSATSEFEHIKREHIGKLSEESYHYLTSLGVPAEKIAEFCKENEIPLDIRISKLSKAQLTLEVFA